jgi:putative two-component system response regulator
MKTIFVVDDNDTNLAAATEALDDVYKTFPLPSAQKMFKLAEKITPDLILLDVEMPEMDGFGALQKLKSDPKLASIPVVFLTARNDEDSEMRGFEMGALDFISKPFSTPVLRKRIEMHIETDLLIKKSQRAVRDIHNATISVIAEMVESRDKVTGGHVERTQAYLKILVDELDRLGTYADERASWNMTLLLSSAQLHDVGKIAISDVVLNNPEKLTDKEFGVIKQHCAEGERIIEQIICKTEDDGFLHHAKRFAGYHHERWDGTGYPRGLKGEEIPLEGRIMALADAYDALVSERPYKEAFTHEQAAEIIKEGSGTHFDPKLVEAFLNIAEDFWVESVSSGSGIRKEN